MATARDLVAQTQTRLEYNDEVNDDDEDREHYCRDFKFSAV